VIGAERLVAEPRLVVPSPQAIVQLHGPSAAPSASATAKLTDAPAAHVAAARAVTAAVGGRLQEYVTALLVVPATPRASLTVTVTVYVPLVAYACDSLTSAPSVAALPVVGALPSPQVMR
jgi:hypothetical protein